MTQKEIKDAKLEILRFLARFIELHENANEESSYELWKYVKELSEDMVKEFKR